MVEGVVFYKGSPSICKSMYISCKNFEINLDIYRISH